MLPHPGKPWFVNAHVTATNGYWTKMRPHDHQVAVAESQHHVIHPTNAGGALDDGVEDWLHVGGRAADDAEHFCRSGLVLQGFAQFSVALLDLFEEPYILDGDHSLVREGFEELDLLVREGSNFGSPNHDSSDGNTFAK